MKYIAGLSVIIVLLSCSTQAPKENEVKEKVQLWYMQRSEADGGGSWDLKGVTVLSVNKDPDRKGVFNAVCFATGTRRSPALAVPRPDEPFSDTVKFSMRWNGAKWEAIE